MASSQRITAHMQDPSLAKMMSGFGKGTRKSAVKFTLFCLAFEVMLVLLYAFTSNYAYAAQATADHSATDGGVGFYYPFFQDVHIMIFIGFGFLMTFVGRYSWSAVGFNFLLSALAIQWGMLCVAFFHRAAKNEWTIFELDVLSLIGGDFAAGALMITYGAVLGKVSATQLVAITFFELIIYAANESILLIKMKIIDMGGSMVIHQFGAYFGLGLSWMLGNPAAAKGDKPLVTPGVAKWSSTGAMIGTIFLWCFWPSFNGALAGGDQQHRVVINTVLAISGSCVAAFAASRVLRHGNKFDFEDMANATLAGGVAVGSSADLVIKPWGAILIGLVAGSLSAFGFAKLTSRLDKYFGIHDACGVHNLHGLPGILGGIAGGVSAAVAGESSYGRSIAFVFPARAPSDPVAAAALGVPPGLGRTAIEQGGFQIAAILVTLALAVAGGIFTGAVIKHPFFDPMTADYYSDDWEWETEILEDQKYAVAEEGHAHGGDVELAPMKATASTGVAPPADIAAIVQEEVRKALARALAAPAVTESAAERPATPATA